MLLARLAETSARVAATSSRRAKTALLAAAVRELAPHEVPAGVALLAGEPRQRQTGVGWAAARDVDAPPAAGPALTVADLDRALDELGALAGPGSQRARRDRLGALLAAATAPEQVFIRALLAGGVRQGALRGLLTDAVAEAAAVPVDAVRRALMLRGDLGEVAVTALRDGAAGLSALGLRVGTPLLPMLASPAAGAAEAVDGMAAAAVEWKLDGVRVQVHRDGGEVAVFTRSLDDVTGRVPEIVRAARALPAGSAVLDGEAILLRPDGRPERFQATGARVARRGEGPELALMLFDVLHADGADLLDLPGAARNAELVRLVPEDMRMPRRDAAGPEDVAAMLADALAHGHEGVVVKDAAAPYAAGRRGAAWRKVKPVHTLDLVVLAAEWGSGRRTGLLSNLHLGARDPASGGYVMLGKTFKGLTDATLRWQTAELLAREASRDRYVVHVRPELVVEIAFDGVQTSRRYPGGVALRFARVVRYRPDKSPAEADTIDAVRALHAAG
ncbi:MAG: ATP-dependent DNA ligase [Thermoleophilia bacterium]|nr:ATP-dependent DNA ligase [Thermoleophilia bacterium]